MVRFDHRVGSSPIISTNDSFFVRMSFTSSKFFNSSDGVGELAQKVEYLYDLQAVVGSSPTLTTKNEEGVSEM